MQGCARACATVTVTRCVHLIQQRVPYTCADDACPGMPDTSGPLPFSSSHARRVTTNPPPHLPQPPPQPQPAPRGVSPDFGRRPLRGAESCLQLSNGGQGASGGGVCTRAPPRQRLRSSFSSPAHLEPRSVQGSGWAMAGWATARQARVGRGGGGFPRNTFRHFPTRCKHSIHPVRERDDRLGDPRLEWITGRGD